MLSSYAADNADDAWKIGVTALFYEPEGSSGDEVSAKSLGKKRTTATRSIAVHTVQRSAVHLVDVSWTPLLEGWHMLKFGVSPAILAWYSWQNRLRSPPSPSPLALSSLQKLSLCPRPHTTSQTLQLQPLQAHLRACGPAGRSQQYSKIRSTSSGAGKNGKVETEAALASLSSRP